MSESSTYRCFLDYLKIHGLYCVRYQVSMDCYALFFKSPTHSLSVLDSFRIVYPRQPRKSLKREARDTMSQGVRREAELYGVPVGDYKTTDKLIITESAQQSAHLSAQPEAVHQSARPEAVQPETVQPYRKSLLDSWHNTACLSLSSQMMLPKKNCCQSNCWSNCWSKSYGHCC